MDNVKKAEEVMKKLSNDDNLVTTTQIRRFLTAVNQVSGKVEKWKQDKKVGSHEALPEELQAQIKYLKKVIIVQIRKDHLPPYLTDEKKLQIKKVIIPVKLNFSLRNPIY